FVFSGEASQVKSKGLTGAGILTVAMIARTTYVPVASINGFKSDIRFAVRVSASGIMDTSFK
ncbi:hypothetical protein V1477_016431, partial [Vespula maculifrons]